MGKTFGRRLVVFLAALALISMSCVVLAQGKGQEKDKIASVNGHVITRDDLNREMGQAQRQIVAGGGKLTDAQLSDLQSRVLDGLIDRELLYQESRKKGIKVGEDEVNNQLSTFKKRFPDVQGYQDSLTRLKLDEPSLKATIEKGLVIKEFIDQEFKPKATISDEEARGFYDTHPDMFKRPEQVRASHILVKVDQGAAEEQRTAAKKKIEDTQARLIKGEDFGTLAKELSECPSSSQNGDLSFFGRGQMVKPFEDAAFSLKNGEVSGIVETRFGYHLIKVTDRQPETLVQYEESKDRLMQFLGQEKLQKEIHAYLEQVKESAKVEKFLD